jgi:hypothetical protein
MMTTNLDDYYESTITRIKKMEEEKEVVMRILSWLFYAKRPLRVIELRHALGIHPGLKSIEEHQKFLPQLERYVDLCAGLVNISVEGKKIPLAHSTVKEYLERNREGISLPGQDRISRDCLTYLSFEDFNTGVDIWLVIQNAFCRVKSIYYLTMTTLSAVLYNLQPLYHFIFLMLKL